MSFLGKRRFLCPLDVKLRGEGCCHPTVVWGNLRTEQAELRGRNWNPVSLFVLGHATPYLSQICQGTVSVAGAINTFQFCFQHFGSL